MTSNYGNLDTALIILDADYVDAYGHQYVVEYADDDNPVICDGCGAACDEHFTDLSTALVYCIECVAVDSDDTSLDYADD